MANPLRRGFVGRVSGWSPSTPEFTPQARTSTYVPHGLRLRQTITSSGAVTIPAGVEWVYAVLAGGGANGFFSYGGGAGQVVWGWTLPQTSCVIGASGSGYSRYGHLWALGGQQVTAQTHFYGIPPGIGYNDSSALSGTPGGMGGRGGAAAGATGSRGGDGISGGGAGQGSATSGTATGGTGGSGLAGGGGGYATGSAGVTRVGGTGGNGLGIDGTIYTGAAGGTSASADQNSGGGAGIAGNASGGTGGLGGGGGGTNAGGGAGILYLFY